MQKLLLPLAYILCLFFFMSNTQYFYAQVTIGSSYASNKGSLLDLKEDENDATKAGGANSTKGIILPRVTLTGNNLDALGSGLDGALYNGLILYNVGDAFGVCPGLYVWNTTEWVPMLDAVPQKDWSEETLNFTTGIGTVTDRDFNIYTVGLFGDAGWWMTQNIQTLKRFDPCAGIKSIHNDAKGENTAERITIPYLFYPQTDGGTSVIAPPDWKLEYGLLYNWSAATSLQNTSTVNQGHGEASESAIELQGICPDGWHLPSDKEWNELEIEINNNISPTSPYSPYAWDGYVIPSSWTETYPAASANRSIHGSLMKAQYNLSNPYIRGYSKDASARGFSVFFTGQGNGDGTSDKYRNTATFWTASAHSNTEAWGRSLSKDNNLVGRHTAGRQSLFSVRCKRNEDVRANKYFIDLPSGKDKRTNTPQTLEAMWNTSIPGVVSWSDPVPTATTYQFVGSVTFASNAITPLGYVLPGSPTTMTIKATDMLDVDFKPNINSTYTPFKSRQSEMTITKAGTKHSQTIILNQTNYALLVEGLSTHRTIALYMDGRNYASTIYSNAVWTATFIDNTNAMIQGLRTTTTNPSIASIISGLDKKTNNYNSHSIFINTKNTLAHTLSEEDTATIILSDRNASEKRFDDVTITVFNCQGSLGTTRAVDVGTETDQSGNVFAYAKFGDAGVWMTENLRATTYAPASTVGLTLPSLPTATSIADDPQWCYPLNISNSSVFDVNPSIGLLYNWTAATGGLNISVLDQGQSSTSETAGSNEVENVSGYIQGICPDGWHLPSDREWNQLERELYNNGDKYSTISLSELNPATWNPNWSTGGIGTSGYDMRGVTNSYQTGHGSVMKSICSTPPKNNNYTDDRSGRSKTRTQGGFSSLHAGYAFDGANGSEGRTDEGYSYMAYFWTSSASADTRAWRRSVPRNISKVSRTASGKNNLFSVRCKKN